MYCTRVLCASVFDYIYSQYLFSRDTDNHTFTIFETEIRINNGWGNDNKEGENKKAEKGKKMFE